MDDKMEFCFICGSHNSTVYACCKCNYPCCQLCLDSHKKDEICKLISDHLINISDNCKDHGNQYTGLCIQCSERTCKECRTKHVKHSIYRNLDAVVKVKDTLQSRRDYLSEQEKKVKSLIEDFPLKLKELRTIEKSVLMNDKRWKTFIEKRNNELLGEITDDMNKLDNECNNLGKYHESLIKARSELLSLEKIQYSWTFIPAWVSIARNLNKFDQSNITSSFLKRKTFMTEIEDPASLSEAFGVIYTAR